MNKILGLIGILLLTSYVAESQTAELGLVSYSETELSEQDDASETELYSRRRQVGFNVTSLLTTMIPFKGGVTPSGPFAVTWRAGRKRFFNFQMGSRLFDTFSREEEENIFLNIHLGFGRHREINDKFSYFNTYNLLFSGGGFNLPGESMTQDGTFGLSFGGGVEYELYEFISINVETYFVVAVNELGPVFRIIPPIGVFLLAKF